MFRRIVDAHSPRLLAAARPFAADADEAHDLVQRTWHRAYQRRRAYSGSGTLLGWLYAVCRNECLGEARSRETRERWEQRAAAARATTDPHQELERIELHRSIWRALMELPARERDVVILRMLEQHSTRETARLLGCAEGTVKAALHHALQKLKGPMEVWVR